MDMGIPRNEYPRPQMRRENWINLNGIWEFAFDFGRTGKERGMQNASKLSREILVPFCPESVLSGIHYLDFMNAVWYRRSFKLDELSNGNRVLLHFEAVDHFSTVYLNGTELGSHTGGFTPFSFDITGQVRPGENVLTVCAEDDSRDPLIPRGKQSEPYASQGCDYTRVTGIWQTVWLEIVPETYLADYRVTTDIDNGTASFALHFNRTGSKQVTVQVLYQGEPMGDARLRCTGDRLCFTVPLKETHLWEVGKGRLYDVLFTVTDANGHEDHVSGYFGMRSVTLSEKALCLNGKPLFQRLVLDQGFYPDGIYTAPSDEALREDILRSMALGFHGARLHQKVFERRFLYWADRLGYLVWGEYGNWGLDHSNPAALRRSALLGQRIRRHPMGPPSGRRLGLRPRAGKSGGIRPALHWSDPGSYEKSQDLRSVLHPALRRGAGKERNLYLRPPAQVYPGPNGAAASGPLRPCGH